VDRDVTARLRAVVADDERPARSFLLALLQSFDDATVVWEAAAGKEAVAIIHLAILSTGKKLQISRLQSRILRERFLTL
jgi:hypothetical protein